MAPRHLESVNFTLISGAFCIFVLGAVHKLRHPIRGYGGVSQKMTKDDRGGGGGPAKDDR